MKNHEFIVIFLLLIAVVSDAGLTSAAGKSLSKPLPLNSTLYKHSHEELHSKSDSATSFSPNISSINVSKPQHQDQSIKTSVPHQQLDGEMLSKPNIVKVTPEPTKSANVSAPTPKHGKVIIAEGGVEVSSQYPLGNKGNETRNNITTVNTVTPNPSNTSKMFDLPVNLTTPGINITQIHKRIHGRPGVSEVVTPSTTTIKSSSTTTLPPRPRKKKPQFTMITGDKESKDSESFIESSTTGRDYVLPIVLIILSLPIVGYLIKIIYRRGTEFTERQQYHRMYLIDGMYNSR